MTLQSKNGFFQNPNAANSAGSNQLSYGSIFKLNSEEWRKTVAHLKKLPEEYRIKYGRFDEFALTTTGLFIPKIINQVECIQQQIAQGLQDLTDNYIAPACTNFSDQDIKKLVSIIREQILTAQNIIYTKKAPTFIQLSSELNKKEENLIILEQLFNERKEKKANKKELHQLSKDINKLKEEIKQLREEIKQLNADMTNATDIMFEINKLSKFCSKKSKLEVEKTIKDPKKFVEALPKLMLRNFYLEPTEEDIKSHALQELLILLIEINNKLSKDNTWKKDIKNHPVLVELLIEINNELSKDNTWKKDIKNHPVLVELLIKINNELSKDDTWKEDIKNYPVLVELLIKINKELNSDPGLGLLQEIKNELLKNNKWEEYHARLSQIHVFISDLIWMQQNYNQKIDKAVQIQTTDISPFYESLDKIRVYVLLEELNSIINSGKNTNNKTLNEVAKTVGEIINSNQDIEISDKKRFCTLLEEIRVYALVKEVNITVNVMLKKPDDKDSMALQNKRLKTLLEQIGEIQKSNKNIRDKNLMSLLKIKQTSDTEIASAQYLNLLLIGTNKIIKSGKKTQDKNLKVLLREIDKIINFSMNPKVKGLLEQVNDWIVSVNSDGKIPGFFQSLNKLLIKACGIKTPLKELCDLRKLIHVDPKAIQMHLYALDTTGQNKSGKGINYYVEKGTLLYDWLTAEANNLQRANAAPQRIVSTFNNHIKTAPTPVSPPSEETPDESVGQTFRC